MSRLCFESTTGVCVEEKREACALTKGLKREEESR